MAQFHYTAIDATGSERKGKLTAADKTAAAQMLQAQGLYVVSLDESGKGLNREVDLSRIYKYLSVPRRQLIFFFKQLSFMLRAGLPVLQAL